MTNPTHPQISVDADLDPLDFTRLVRWAAWELDKYHSGQINDAGLQASWQKIVAWLDAAEKRLSLPPRKCFMVTDLEGVRMLAQLDSRILEKLPGGMAAWIQETLREAGEAVIRDIQNPAGFHPMIPPKPCPPFATNPVALSPYWRIEQVTRQLEGLRDEIKDYVGNAHMPIPADLPFHAVERCLFMLKAPKHPSEKRPPAKFLWCWKSPGEDPVGIFESASEAALDAIGTLEGRDEKMSVDLGNVLVDEEGEVIEPTFIRQFQTTLGELRLANGIVEKLLQRFAASVDGSVAIQDAVEDLKAAAAKRPEPPERSWGWVDDEGDARGPYGDRDEAIDDVYDWYSEFSPPPSHVVFGRFHDGGVSDAHLSGTFSLAWSEVERIARAAVSPSGVEALEAELDELNSGEGLGWCWIPADVPDGWSVPFKKLEWAKEAAKLALKGSHHERKVTFAFARAPGEREGHHMIQYGALVEPLVWAWQPQDGPFPREVHQPFDTYDAAVIEAVQHYAWMGDRQADGFRIQFGQGEEGNFEGAGVKNVRTLTELRGDVLAQEISVKTPTPADDITWSRKDTRYKISDPGIDPADQSHEGKRSASEVLEAIRNIDDPPLEGEGDRSRSEAIDRKPDDPSDYGLIGRMSNLKMTDVGEHDAPSSDHAGSIEEKRSDMYSKNRLPHLIVGRRPATIDMTTGALKDAGDTDLKACDVKGCEQVSPCPYHTLHTGHPSDASANALTVDGTSPVGRVGYGAGKAVQMAKLLAERKRLDPDAPDPVVIGAGEREPGTGVGLVIGSQHEFSGENATGGPYVVHDGPKVPFAEGGVVPKSEKPVEPIVHGDSVVSRSVAFELQKLFGQLSPEEEMSVAPSDVLKVKEALEARYHGVADQIMAEIVDRSPTAAHDAYRQWVADARSGKDGHGMPDGPGPDRLSRTDWGLTEAEFVAAPMWMLKSLRLLLEAGTEHAAEVYRRFIKKALELGTETGYDEPSSDASASVQEVSDGYLGNVEQRVEGAGESRSPKPSGAHVIITGRRRPATEQEKARIRKRFGATSSAEIKRKLEKMSESDPPEQSGGRKLAKGTPSKPVGMRGEEGSPEPSEGGES